MLYLYLSKDHIILQIGATTVKFVDLTLYLHGILSFVSQVFSTCLTVETVSSKVYCFQFVLYCKKKNT